MFIRRTDRGLLANWWFTVDRTLLLTFFLLMAVGLLINMASSPAVAGRIGLEMSESDQLHPEQSTSAIVLHHPQAKYFSV